ncbi:amino acid permease, partial [Lactobacillus sp. UMNPBX16]
MGEVNNRSVPVTSLVFSSLTLLIIVVLNFILPAKIFEIISDISTVCFIFVWLTLLWCHYKYRRQNPEGTSFKMPLYPISNFVTMAFFIGILG